VGGLETLIVRAKPAETFRSRLAATSRSWLNRVDANLLLVLPAALLMLTCFAWPVVNLLKLSFMLPQPGIGNYQALFARPVYLRVLLNTVAISASVALLCLVVGYAIAYIMATASPRTRRLLIFVVLIPFWSSVLVRSFAWMVLLQRNGLVNDMLIGLGLIHRPVQLVYNRTGVLIGMVQILLPFMIFPLFAVMSRINPSYAEAASTLGAGPVRGFLRVYFPLTLPGVLTGTSLVFVLALGYYIIPALLGGLGETMIAQLIEQQVADFGNWGMAGALSAVLLAGTAIILTLIMRLYRLGNAWRR
jgi:putative spermidine/putrescine transport system permease protein